jgi:hypothetical protein
MASAKVAVAAEARLPAARRDRLFIVDDFLPLEQAEAMRQAIDDHFADPNAHGADTHQIWNYWFVPDLYAYLRTQPEKVIAKPQVDAFVERLRVWSAQTLGLARVTWPYLSCYVAGCRQELHNDSANGRFGYVYSLTREDRKTLGGDTIVHHEGDAFRALSARPGAGHSFFDAVAPRFNRLVLFDDRMPHAVTRLEGSMDPREGRFVLHGHISESEPIIAGALPGDALLGPVNVAFRTFTEGVFLDGYHGPVTIRLDIAPKGEVSAHHVLLDRVIYAGDGESRWPMLLGDLLARLTALRFPAAPGPSQVLLPVSFGQPPR